MRLGKGGGISQVGRVGLSASTDWEVEGKTCTQLKHHHTPPPQPHLINFSGP